MYYSCSLRLLARAPDDDNDNNNDSDNDNEDNDDDNPNGPDPGANTHRNIIYCKGILHSDIGNM